MGLKLFRDQKNFYKKKIRKWARRSIVTISKLKEKNSLIKIWTKIWYRIPLTN